MLTVLFVEPLVILLIIYVGWVMAALGMALALGRQ